MAKKSMFDDSQSRGFAIKILNEDVAKKSGVSPSRNIIGVLDKDFIVQAVVEVDFLPATGKAGVLYVLPSGEMAIWRASSGLWQIVGGGGGGGSTTLQPIQVTTKIGAYQGNETIPAGTEFEEIFRNILTTVSVPSLTNPSASLAGPTVKLYETGYDFNNVDFKTTFNRGAINPPYTAESPYRSGEATNYKLLIDGTQKYSNDNGDFRASIPQTQTVDEKIYTFSSTVDYAEGCQPKDSAGNDYMSPLPAGTSTSNTIKIEFVHALYANGNGGTSVTKLPLVSKGNKHSTEIETGTHLRENPETYDVPASYQNVRIETWAELAQEWQSIMHQIAVTDVTHTDLAGNTVNYKRYQDNRGLYSQGNRKIRISWDN